MRDFFQFCFAQQDHIRFNENLLEFLDQASDRVLYKAKLVLDEQDFLMENFTKHQH